MSNDAGTASPPVIAGGRGFGEAACPGSASGAAPTAENGILNLAQAKGNPGQPGLIQTPPFVQQEARHDERKHRTRTLRPGSRHRGRQ